MILFYFLKSLNKLLSFSSCNCGICKIQGCDLSWDFGEPFLQPSVLLDASQGLLTRENLAWGKQNVNSQKLVTSRQSKCFWGEHKQKQFPSPTWHHLLWCNQTNSPNSLILSLLSVLHSPHFSSLESKIDWITFFNTNSNCAVLRRRERIWFWLIPALTISLSFLPLHPSVFQKSYGNIVNGEWTRSHVLINSMAVQSACWFQSKSHIRWELLCCCWCCNFFCCCCYSLFWWLTLEKLPRKLCTFSLIFCCKWARRLEACFTACSCENKV